MIEIVREFIVRQEARGQFELAFGPGGLWSRVFSACEGFRGTTVLRSIKDTRRYLVIEVWDTEAHRQQALADHPAEHADLQAAFSEWVETEGEVGTFTMLAQAAVRPHAKAGKSTRRR
ncbi:MAG: hypothetical protein Kow00124_07560 [Anaerolineae bacterium]